MTDLPERSYPEHEKLGKVADKSQTIGEFLDWASEQGWHLAQWEEGRHFDHRMMPLQKKTTDILAQYFEIDLDVIETEKRAMIEEVRSLHDL